MTGVSFWQSNSIDGHLELTNATRSLTPFSRFSCAYIPCSMALRQSGVFITMRVLNPLIRLTGKNRQINRLATQGSKIAMHPRSQ